MAVLCTAASVAIKAVAHWPQALESLSLSLLETLAIATRSVVEKPRVQEE